MCIHVLCAVLVGGVGEMKGKKTLGVQGRETVERGKRGVGTRG